MAKSTKYAPRPKKEKKNKKNNEVKEKEGLDVSHSGNGPVLSPARDVENGVAGNEEDEEVETPQLGLWMCIGLLIVVTVVSIPRPLSDIKRLKIPPHSSLPSPPNFSSIPLVA